MLKNESETVTPIVDRKCVAIIDLNILNKLYFRDVLQHAGYDILLADTVPDLTAMCHTTLPDLIMMHALLPDRSCTENLALIRRHRGLEETPVILLSTRACDRHQNKRIESYGFAALADLPMPIPDLLRTVENAICKLQPRP